LVKFHVDHKTPLSRGGSNWPSNIVCACAECNMKKNAKTAEEFLSESVRASPSK
jgi:5-methylcytosine-specific restriction endonuclease McrA